MLFFTGLSHQGTPGAVGMKGEKGVPGIAGPSGKQGLPGPGGLPGFKVTNI